MKKNHSLRKGVKVVLSLFVLTLTACSKGDFVLDTEQRDARHEEHMTPYSAFYAYEKVLLNNVEQMQYIMDFNEEYHERIKTRNPAPEREGNWEQYISLNELEDASRKLISEINFSAEELRKMTQGKVSDINKLSQEETINLAVLSVTVRKELNDGGFGQFACVDYYATEAFRKKVEDGTAFPTGEDELDDGRRAQSASGTPFMSTGVGPSTRSGHAPKFDYINVTMGCIAEVLGLNMNIYNLGGWYIRNFGSSALKSLIVGVVMKVGVRALGFVGLTITVGQVSWCVYQKRQKSNTSNTCEIIGFAAPSWWNSKFSISVKGSWSLPVIVLDPKDRVIYSDLPKNEIGKKLAIYKRSWETTESDTN